MKWFMLVLGLLCLYISSAKASPFNKYGRTCKDILCTTREECVMQEDQCTTYSQKCGSYPTCKRKPGGTATGCASIRCPSGHFCSIQQEKCDRPPCQIVPKCIAFRTVAPPKSSFSSVSSSSGSKYDLYPNSNRGGGSSSWGTWG